MCVCVWNVYVLTQSKTFRLIVICKLVVVCEEVCRCV